MTRILVLFIGATRKSFIALFSLSATTTPKAPKDKVTVETAIKPAITQEFTNGLMPSILPTTSSTLCTCKSDKNRIYNPNMIITDKTRRKRLLYL